MAEEFDDGLEPSEESADVLAAQIALSEEDRRSGEAREYLKKQSRIADLQLDVLRKKHEFELSHLRWRRFNDQLNGVLRILLVIFGLGAVVAVAAAVWLAIDADGVVVDSFSVPPALAQAGLNGDVLAGDVTNKLAEMRRYVDSVTVSITRGIRSNSKDEVRIEIPESGISLTALWRDLRDWLGNEQHVTGSVRDVGGGRVALVVSMTGSDPMTFVGDNAHLGLLEQAAAEALFSKIAPITSIFYLDARGRYAEALAAAKRATERGLATRYGLIGNQLPLATGDFARAVAYARLAMMLAPKVQIFRINLVDNDQALGWAEEELQTARTILPLREIDQSLIGETRSGYEGLRHRAKRRVALLTGDFADPRVISCFDICAAGEEFVLKAIVAGFLHDTREGVRLLALARVAGDADPDDQALAAWSVAIAKTDWQGAKLAAAELQHALAEDSKGLAPRYGHTIEATRAIPRLALAEAHLGAIADAHRAIDGTPRDCYDCTWARGVIAALEGNQNVATYWFARSVALAPSIPFAYAEWGAMLLHKGDYDGAIGKFRTANLKGPHFADPLEMWGEALMQQNRSDLALANFEEANKYAPDWGRLHLEWGKAQFYAGHKDEAKNQFLIASNLDLSKDDKAALTLWLRRK